MSSDAWEWCTLPNGQRWRPWLFKLLDEDYIQRDHEWRPIALVVPGRPELYAYAPSSLAAAAGFSNPSRGLDQLLACPSLSRIEMWRVGSGNEVEIVVVEHRSGLPAQPPPDGTLLVIFSGTPDVASAGAAIRAENYAWMMAGKKKLG